MMEKLIVTSNCMTGGVAGSFKIFFPDYEIQAISLPGNDEQRAALLSALEDCAVWFTLDYCGLKHQIKCPVILLPKFVFDAFHPDLTYASRKSTRTLIEPHYNSHIVVWCYRNQIEPADAAKLFRGRVFEALGYYNRWDASVATMRNHWREAGYSEKEFLQFYLALKRDPTFMYSINHPKLRAVVEYARAVARKFDPKRASISREVFLHDGLMGFIWPIYPEIALELGVPGNYVWRRDGGVEHYSPREYIEYAYGTYRDAGAGPDDIKPFLELPRIDEILRQSLSGR